MLSSAQARHQEAEEDSVRAVYKYLLIASADQTIDMPSGAQILAVRFQEDGLYVWAVVDTDGPMRPRRFGVFGTGHQIPVRSSTYCGTAEMPLEKLIFHVFEWDA